jgi:hypothetical protein
MYARRLGEPPRTDIRQEPPRRRSRMPQNAEGLSNLGQHNQSMDPSRDTSAAERPSPMSA